ncbi:RNA-directed DNA polymerase [Arachis hypogaea]|nr:RNA-directed DNA polymerase [Arachis hypogaea]
MVMEVLNTFCKAFELKVNFEKSKAICSKHVSNTKKNIFTGASSIHFTQNLKKYYSSVNLGHLRETHVCTTKIIEKIQRDLASWKGRLLNRVGRLCLIKSVISLFIKCIAFFFQVMLMIRLIFSSANFFGRVTMMEDIFFLLIESY